MHDSTKRSVERIAVALNAVVKHTGEGSMAHCQASLLLDYASS
jgi:hypothetical protein